MDKISFHRNNKPTDIVELLYWFFIEKRATFSSGGLQCYAGKARSRTDAWLLVKTYFPKVKRKHLFAAIDKLIEDGVLSRNWCFFTRRFVHNPRNYSVNEDKILQSVQKSESGRQILPKRTYLKANQFGW